MERPVKVLKFGGTSVTGAEAAGRIVEIIAADAAPRKVVVVSAPAGVTTLLFRAARNQGGHTAVSELIRRQGQELEAPAMLVQNILEDLRADLASAGDCDDRTARVVSHGERASAQLLADCLTRRGLPAVAVDAREIILTDSEFLNARYYLNATARRVRDRLEPLLTRGVLPVVTGYIAADARGRTTTLGRGGSDLTATLLGACLDAEVVEIWSDADGVMTADPRVVPGARLLRRLSYDEAVELSNFGAKILFNKSLAPAMQAGIRVHVRNTFNAGSPGTVIAADNEDPHFAVTSVGNVTVATVANPEMVGAVGYLAKLFNIFQELKMSVDVVAVSEASVSVTVRQLDGAGAAALTRALAPLGKTTVTRDRAMVAVISQYLARRPEVFGEIFTCLAANGIAAEVISYGNSRLNLTLVVDGRREREAVTLIHNLCQEALTYAPTS